MFYRTGVIADRSFTLWEKRYFLPFCSCGLDLDPMTFIYELDPKTMEIYCICKYELPMSRLLKVIIWETYIQTDRHTDRQDQKYYTCCFAGADNNWWIPVSVQSWKVHVKRPPWVCLSVPASVGLWFNDLVFLPSQALCCHTLWELVLAVSAFFWFLMFVFDH